MSIHTENPSPPELSPPVEELAALPPVERPGLDAWLVTHLDIFALMVLGVGLALRAIAAAESYLNPDEALHYLYANQPSIMLAYTAGMTNAHPPLFFLMLYFWRFVGASEFMLRLPSVLAGTAVLWVAYKWVSNVFGRTTGVTCLLLLAFSPAMISLSAEVRGYPGLLLCMASSLYCLERAFAEGSPRMMVFFSMFLYLAILTHYSALWFTVAVGAYALLRLVGRQLPAAAVKVWVAGQSGAVAMYALLYVTRISKLKGSGMEQRAMTGWLSEQYFNPGKDNLLLFPLKSTVAFFQYIAGQRGAGIAMLLMFLAGVAIVSTRGVPREQRQSPPYALGVLLLLPFVLSCAAAILRIYPYGGTRHSVFLVLFAAAGASLLPTQLAGRRVWPVLIAALVVVAAWSVNAELPAQHIDRQNQRQVLMGRAVEYIRQSIPPGGLVFVDYQSSAMLGYYLGREQPFPFGKPPQPLLESSSGGYRVVSSKVWLFDVDSFADELSRLRRAYGLRPEDLVWVVQAGWGANLYTELTRRFRNVYFPGVMFGENLSVFQVPAGFEPGARR